MPNEHVKRKIRCSKCKLNGIPVAKLFKDTQVKRYRKQGEGKNIRVPDGQTVEQNPRAYQKFSPSNRGHGFLRQFRYFGLEI
jgi:hypothetical protein